MLKRELMAPYEYDKRNDLHKRGFFSRLKHGFGHAFSKIKKGVSKIKHVAKAIGRGIKKAGHYIKHNAAKFGKFGLKVVAAAASVAGRVAKFVPGIGTAVSLGLKGVAMGANFASNHIHARLGGVLGRISGGLNYVESPLGMYSRLSLDTLLIAFCTRSYYETAGRSRSRCFVSLRSRVLNNNDMCNSQTM